MINIDTQKVLIWSSVENKLIEKTEVYVQLVGTQGTVYMEEGPILVSTGSEMFEATQELRERLQRKIANSI